MADSANHDELVTQFCELTGATPEEATQYLGANRFDLPGAAAEYFTAQEEGIQAAQEGGEDDPQEAEAYTGPRTLDGRPAPSSIPTVGSSASASASSRKAPPSKKGGIATLSSINQEPSGHGHGHAHDDDDDDDDENDDDFKPSGEPRDLFAGGEKSGLAVQDPSNRNDPRKVVNDILKKARANASRTGGEPAGPSNSRFHGSGQTLGGDDAPSQTVPDPQPRTRDPGPVQSRILHLWEDGFSVEDGELRRFDDPQNAADLQMIRQGRAPLHLMGVEANQPVDVQLMKHEGNYKPQPKVYKPFSGGGQRLGSPTPGGPSTTTTSTPAPASGPPAAAAATPSTPEVEIDSSAPTLSLRIQLADGTRLPARFNTTHTIGDVYSFINRAQSSERPWVLATTFPNKDHTDQSLVLGEMAEFKRGGTAVQKWA